MAGKIDAKLKELGLELPDAPAPAANYVPYVKSGNLVFVSGQISIGPDGLITGTLGKDMSVEDGAAAARVCALNLIAQVRSACGGDLDRVTQVVRLGGFVACTADFTQHPVVINGASDLMADVFGDKSAHARAAVGVPSLPLGVAVEIDGIFEIE